MSVWNVYDERNEVRGQTRRETVRRREISRLERRVPDSLSYHDVEIFDNAHGYDIESVDGGESVANTPITKNVAIINTDNLNEKFICSLPEDDIEHGSLVHWMDNYWLVTERDANTTLYTKSKMVQCNHLLRWVDTKGIVHAQWCIIEDGTKLKRILLALWFGMLETACKNSSLNCWNTLRANPATTWRRTASCVTA